MRSRPTRRTGTCCNGCGSTTSTPAACRSRWPYEPAMRVGLVSPYPWDVPGGVVAHVRDLAETLIRRGHDVSVISPVDDDDVPLPGWVTRAGRSVPVPFNGSVSRLVFGPVSAARVRRWLAEG